MRRFHPRRAARMDPAVLAMRRGAWRAAAHVALWGAVVAASASASAVDRPALPFEPYTATGPVTCAPDGPLGAVESDAWAEIERLGEMGLPVCDVVWVFWRGENGRSSAGWAYSRHSDEDPRPSVWIETDIDHHVDPGPDGVDAEELTQEVRSLVRHELGHALTYLLGADDLEKDAAMLRDLFPGALEDGPVHPGFEAAADAIAEELTPPGEERLSSYDVDISPGNAANARAMLDLFGFRPS